MTASGQVGGINVGHGPAGEEIGNLVHVPGINEVINNTRKGESIDSLFHLPAFIHTRKSEGKGVSL